MNRRTFLQAAGMAGSLASLAGVNGCLPAPRGYAANPFYIRRGTQPIPKLRVSLDRVVKETVGLRPFRASGPRLDVQLLDHKTIVHNYGHGGSVRHQLHGPGDQGRFQ